MGNLIENVLTSWYVDEETPTKSDHRYILYELSFEVTLKVYKRFKTKYTNFKEFNTKFKKFNKQLLEALEEIVDTRELEKFIENLTNIIQSVALKSFKLKSNKYFPNASWWSGELRAERNKLKALYKKLRKSTNNETIQVLTIKYRKSLAQYKKKIKIAKLNSWKSFCTNHSDTYGTLFKILNNKLLSTTDLIYTNLETLPINSDYEDVQNELLNYHFDLSSSPPPEFSMIPTFSPLLSKREFFYALGCQSLNKAPGHDRIDGRIVKNLATKFFKLIYNIYNKCFQLNYFPKIWKKSIIVFFTKKNKNHKQPSSYRPISLLPVMGKLLERLIKNRMNFQLDSKNFLNPNQYGFRSCRSTTILLNETIQTIKNNLLNYKYCTLISFDIQGAFNNIIHDVIIQIIDQLPVDNYIKNMLKSFLNYRTIQIDYKGEIINYFTLKGCPQGSCLGPSLWLLVADKLLKNLETYNLFIKAYADDFILIEKANTRRQLELNTNKAIEIFNLHCSHLLLSVSESKTLGILFGPKLLEKRRPIFKLNNSTIKIQNQIKYLGIYLDAKLNFIYHLNYLSQKISNFNNNIIKSKGKNWGIKFHLLRLWYLTVTEKRLEYASEAWFKYTNIHGKRKLKSIQRKCLIPISGSYKSAATDGLLAILGIPPIELTFQQKCKKFEIQILKKEIMINDIKYDHSDFDFTNKIMNINPALEISNLKLLEESITIVESEYDTHIYTDGSKNETGTSYGFTAYKNKNFYFDYNSRIYDNNSIFQAELTAIKHAMQWAIQNNYLKILISSDSQSALLSIFKFFPDNSIVLDILRLAFLNPDKFFVLIWVKAHVGIEGNERADRLAKQPLIEQYPIDNYNIPLPLSFLKSELKNELLSKWQLNWDYSDTGRYTYQFIPKISLQPTTFHKVITYFITGHGSFPSFLYKINKSNSDLCICGCQGLPLHYVFDSCPLVPYKFKSNPNISLFQNFLLLIKNPRLVSRLLINYAHLNQHYSDYF